MAIAELNMNGWGTPVARTCCRCGVEFVAGNVRAKWCPKCRKARNHRVSQFGNELRRTAKAKRPKADASRKEENNQRRMSWDMMDKTMARIRRHRVHVEAGWRGQRVGGGGKIRNV